MAMGLPGGRSVSFVPFLRSKRPPNARSSNYSFVLACTLGAFPNGSLVAEGTISKETPRSGELQVRRFSDLQRFAKQLAHQAYRPEPPLVEELAKMEYDQYREIQLKHEKATWSDDKHPFWLEFFHRGFVQRDRVECYLIPENSWARQAKREVNEVVHSPDQFRFSDQVTPSTLPRLIGFAGIKIAGRVTPNGDPQELLTFIGSKLLSGSDRANGLRHVRRRIGRKCGHEPRRRISQLSEVLDR